VCRNHLTANSIPWVPHASRILRSVGQSYHLRAPASRCHSQRAKRGGISLRRGYSFVCEIPSPQLLPSWSSEHSLARKSSSNTSRTSSARASICLRPHNYYLHSVSRHLRYFHGTKENQPTGGTRCCGQEAFSCFRRVFEPLLLEISRSAAAGHPAIVFSRFSWLGIDLSNLFREALFTPAHSTVRVNRNPT
jgi:hypothetical protein